MIIEVSHLSKHYGNYQAVNDLSFSVKKGEVHGFLGQNGAGKSTTIRMLLGLIAPDSGSIRIFGKSLYESRNHILSRTGAIIERPDHYKFLSAYENLSIFSRLSGQKPEKKKIMHFLGMVGLADRAYGKVSTFSQGMKQRLGLAIALIHEPELLILDEPVNGLDPQGIAEVRSLILSLSRQEGKTILLSSHLLSEIEQMADSMLIIEKGKKIVEGRVADLLNPAESIIRMVTTNDQAALALLRGSAFGAFLTETDNGIQLNMHRDAVAALTKIIFEAGIGILSVQNTHSLEAYFLSLTNNRSDVAVIAN